LFIFYKEGEEEKSYVSKKEKKKALGISAGIIKDLRTNNEEFQQTFTIKSERTAVMIIYHIQFFSPLV
jgi:hypothetical protein